MTDLSPKMHEKLSEIVTATRRDPAGPLPAYVFAHTIGVKALVDAGMIEGNADIKHDDGKQIAYRATAVGINHANAHDPNFDAAKPLTQPVAEHNTAVEAAIPQPPVTPVTRKPTMSDFVLETVPVPEAVKADRRGGARPELYPFSKMEVGQSFFVPKSAEKPDPLTSMGSTARAATARYAEPKKDAAGVVEMRTNRKGESVPVMVETRKYAVYKDTKDNVEGVRVFRTA